MDYYVAPVIIWEGNRILAFYYLMNTGIRALGISSRSGT